MQQWVRWFLLFVAFLGLGACAKPAVWGLHKDSCKSGHSIRAGSAGGLFLLFRTDELHRLFQILE